MEIDRLAEIIADGFAKIDRRFDALEQRMGGLEQRMDGFEQRLDGFEQRLERMRIEMNERFQSVDDRFATMDLRFDQVNARLDHIAERQEALERQFEPFPALVYNLEKSLRTSFADVIRQLEGTQLQVVVTNERLDRIADEMRQRFRLVNERLS